MPERIRVSGNCLTYAGKEYRCATGKGGIISADLKREGDGGTPIGIYPLRECWYRADRLSAPATLLPRRIITPGDKWCDDQVHPWYNRHFIFPSSFTGEGQGGGEPPKLLPLARQLRQNMTQAEKILWYHLRAHRFEKYGFRRQRPMRAGYIADFVCPKKKLIVEVDGGQHADSKEDALTDDYFIRQGYRVLRFWNDEVDTQLESVLERILSTLDTMPVLTPSLTLPPAGGGDVAVPASYEELWREGHVYDVVIPLGYNDSPVIPGKGSAIFLHVAKPDYAPTEGCVALALSDLLELLSALDASAMLEVKN